jgi:hypothetical protein
MKRQYLTSAYVTALLCATALFAYALVRVHGRFTRLADPIVIIACNAAFWAFIWHIIAAGEFKTGGESISFSESPKRFTIYVYGILLAGIVASVVGAAILISKAGPL